MVKEEKILLMTKLAIYEEKQEKNNIQINSYTRKDYVGMELIKTFLCSTVAFLILIGLRLLIDLDTWVEHFSSGDILAMVLRVLIEYGVFIIVYQVIAYFLYRRRYEEAKVENKAHRANLKKAGRYQIHVDSAVGEESVDE